MRKRVLTFIAACFYYSGLVWLARWWKQRSGQHLIILNYHHASGGDLRSHLLYLRRHYRILHLEVALEELYNSSKNSKTMHDQRLPLVLTFDDGYHDNYTHGLALARELQIPFTVFLVPGYTENHHYFWWDESNRLASHAQKNEVTIDGRTYQLNQAEERNKLAQDIAARVCQAASVAEREAFFASTRKELAVPVNPDDQNQDLLPLTWSEIREMEESGWVSFGAHTMHHPVLAYLNDPTEVQEEVKQCRAVLEQQLGHPIRTFAYPIGQRQHIGDNAIRAVRQAGYAAALTTIHGFNTPQSDPYLLRRIEADTSQHWLVVAAEAAGLWGFFSRLRWFFTMRTGLYRKG